MAISTVQRRLRMTDFWETFSWQVYLFIYLSFCQKSAERKSPKKYFLYFVLISGLGFETWLYVRVYARTLLRGNRRWNIFFLFHVSFWCLTWNTNPGYTSNKPAHYLQDYGGIFWFIYFYWIFFFCDFNKPLLRFWRFFF